MSELPLFPLHTVLFPQTPIQLHIFEDRYQRMIGMCLQEKRPFGVILIRRGSEALGPLAEPYQVGCTAEIVTSQPLPEGRLNITAVGGERFRIRSLDDHSHPYLTGDTEPHPWRTLTPRELPARTDALRSQLQRYLVRLASIGGSEVIFDPKKLPESAFDLACLAAAVLDIDSVQKQELLESESLDEFIDQLRRIYRREGVLMQALIDRGERGEQSFSLN